MESKEFLVRKIPRDISLTAAYKKAIGVIDRRLTEAAVKASTLDKVCCSTSLPAATVLMSQKGEIKRPIYITDLFQTNSWREYVDRCAAQEVIVKYSLECIDGNHEVVITAEF